MAITTCGHAEALLYALAKCMEAEEDDVEAGILNALAHRAYKTLGLRSDASGDAVENALRAFLLEEGDFDGLFGN